MLLDHLHGRHLNTDLHKVWCDDFEGVATFPVYTLLGQMTGYQQYRPGASKEKKNHPREGRYYTYSIKGARGVWGLEAWSLSRCLFVAEGVFCAARITNLGYSAIATLSNDPKFLGGWFKAVRSMRPVIAICDHGEAGIKLKQYAHHWHQMPCDFDFGDAPADYAESVLKKLVS